MGQCDWGCDRTADFEVIAHDGIGMDMVCRECYIDAGGIPPEGPARLCCGQRHWTPQCPDGLTMCCICFMRFPLEDLNARPDGKREDVCKPCAKEEP